MRYVKRSVRVWAAVLIFALLFAQSAFADGYRSKANIDLRETKLCASDLLVLSGWAAANEESELVLRVDGMGTVFAASYNMPEDRWALEAHSMNDSEMTFGYRLDNVGFDISELAVGDYKLQIQLRSKKNSNAVETVQERKLTVTGEMDMPSSESYPENIGGKLEPMQAVIESPAVSPWKTICIIAGILLVFAAAMFAAVKLLRAKGIFLLSVLEKRIPKRSAKTKNNSEGMSTVIEAASEEHRAISVGYAQTIGARPNQEDSYCVSSLANQADIAGKGVMAIVCDGIGGLNGGEIASSIAVDSAMKVYNRLNNGYLPEERLLHMVAAAQQNVRGQNYSDRKKSGCTFISAIVKDNELSFISVGDSRISIFRNGSLMTLNREHVLSRDNDEKAVLGNRSGIKPGSGKAITSYIGCEKLEKIDRNLSPIRLRSGDQVLLMTDGVFGTLDDDEIIACLNESVMSAAGNIIKKVDEKHKLRQDNATIVIIGICK